MPTWKGVPVLGATFTARSSLGVSCLLFFSNGCDVQHFAGALLRGEAETARVPFSTGASRVPASVFRVAEDVARGNVQGRRRPAVHTADAPQRRSPGAAYSGASACITSRPSSSSPFPRLPAARALLPLCHPHRPPHPGCVTSRAPDMSYSRLSSEVKRTGITGDKKALALCCPQL